MWIVEQYEKSFWKLNEPRMLISNCKCEVKDQSISIVSFSMDLKSLNPILVMLILFWFHVSFFYCIDLSIHSNEYSSSLPAYVIGFIWHSDSIWLLDSFLRYESEDTILVHSLLKEPIPIMQTGILFLHFRWHISVWYLLTALSKRESITDATCSC